MKTFKQYLKHPMMWINALLGRPTHIEIPSEQVTHQESSTTEAAQSSPVAQTQAQGTQSMTREVYDEDPLKKDLEKAKNLFSKFSSRAHTLADPAIERGMAVSNEAASASSAFVKTNRFKKIIPIIIVLVLIILFGFLALMFLRRNGGGEEIPVVISDPTPTLAPFVPSQPSIYSSDAEVLKLEQDITVLDQEIAGTALRETTLNPPSLDFNINFK
jgi:hypothetical protein